MEPDDRADAPERDDHDDGPASGDAADRPQSEGEKAMRQADIANGEGEP